MKEMQIEYQQGEYWVARFPGHHSVFIDTPTHAQVDSTYPNTPDGLSLERARVDYLAKRASKATETSKRYPDT